MSNKIGAEGGGSVIVPPGVGLRVLNGLFVHKAGDTMGGDLVFPVTGFIMTDTNSVQWRVTVNTSGALVTTQIVVSTSGPWLSLGFTLFST